MPSDLGHQLPRFAGSVVWAKLPSPPNKPSSLSKGELGKVGVVNELLEDDESWAAQAADPKSTALAEKATQEGLVAAMAELTVQLDSTTESTVLEWRRAQEKPGYPKPSVGRAGSILQ